MIIRRFTKRLVLCALAALFLAGCGDDLGGRCAVTGTVTFQGKPLDQGFITFIPLAPGQATQSGTAIANGAYAIPKNKGLVPGHYRISISSGDGETPAGPTDQPPGPSGNFSSKDRIPSDYNFASQHDVEVKPKGPNQFNFDIP